MNEYGAEYEDDANEVFVSPQDRQRFLDAVTGETPMVTRPTTIKVTPDGVAATRRAEALRNAVWLAAGNDGNTSADTVINLAKRFERYLEG